MAKKAWGSLPERLSFIIPVVIPDKTTVLHPPDLPLGNARPMIQSAIDKTAKAGGGKVILSEGDYFSKGPIHLRSNIQLHLEKGAKLLFSDRAEDYLPLVKVRWEGTVCWNWSPLIYAYQAENIAITGEGEIDGHGQDWSKKWRKLQKSDQTLLRQMGNDLIPEDQRIFGNGILGDAGDGQMHYLRPSLIEFYECKHILLEGLTLRNSPFWTVHPVFSKNIHINRLRIFGGYLNDDGIDPDSCEDVLIENCFIQTHDDAISIKAGRDQDAWDRPGSRNIIVQNCELASLVNAFCIGSEMSGGVKEVFLENSRILQGKYAINFKCNLDRGGEVAQVFIRNLEIDTVSTAMLLFTMDYHSYRGNHFPTSFNHIFLQNLSCQNAGEYGFKITGVEDAPIERVLLDRIQIEKADTNALFDHTNNIVQQKVFINGLKWKL
ncbi:MAG TPA: glycoside hydrolase family 28 protein [Saprospiraceae bacterium]|nr:glycoside hydrolase family 28 protein [Saprospiraceae bacterium]HMQ81447.1 glycoside hydrolase family 28 protein [Saprospiraceae bacterium]